MSDGPIFAVIVVLAVLVLLAAIGVLLMGGGLVSRAVDWLLPPRSERPVMDIPLVDPPDQALKFMPRTVSML